MNDNYILYPNGSKCPIFPKEKDGMFTVTQLQDVVGGYIGVQDMGEQCLVYNDEGDLDDRPYNEEATALIRGFNEEFRRIVSGPVVVCRRGRIKV